MQKIAFFAAAAATFALAPLAGRLGPLTGAALLLALAVALALAASGTASAVAAAGGALGAFAGAVLSATSPALGGAVLVGLCYAERTLRVRGDAGGRAAGGGGGGGGGARGGPRLAHLAAALGGGALAGVVTTSYASASLAVRGVAVVVAAVLVALPLLVEADDPVAHALDGAADDVAEPARTKLREGAELRRHADEELLDRGSAREVRRTWRSLLRLAEVRLRLERSRAGRPASAHADAVAARVDGAIEDHVRVLTRAYVAVDTARAAEISLDDAAARSVEHVGESLEQVSKAIVEET